MQQGYQISINGVLTMDMAVKETSSTSEIATCWMREDGGLTREKARCWIQTTRV
jgi:hypothetical protein